MTTIGLRPEASFQKLDPVDAGWAGIEYVRVFAGLDVASTSDLRRAVALVLADSPVGWIMDDAAVRRRRPSPREIETLLDAMVLPAARCWNQVDVDQALAEAAAPLDGLPFRLHVGKDWLAVRMTHALADGWSCLTTVGHLLAQAASSEPLRAPWEVVPTRQRDALLLRMLAARPGTVARTWRRRHDYAGGSYAGAGEHVPVGRHTTVYRCGEPQVGAVLRAWRDEHSPGASMAALVLVGLRAGLSRHLVEPLPGMEVVFDVRREHPRLNRAFGNWAAGIFVRPADDGAPAAVSAALGALREDGVPLVAVAAARRRGRRPSNGERRVAAPIGRPRLTLSYINAHGPVAALPWGENPVLVTSTVPNGPETVTIAAQEIGGTLHLGLCFYGQMWARSAVEAAVDDFLTAPTAHLIDVDPAEA